MSKKSNKKNNDYLKKMANKKADQPDKTNKVKYQAQPEVKLTAYTFIAMITIAVSAAATALGAIILAKPVYYGMEMIYYESVDPVLLELLVPTLFGDNENKIKLLLTIAVALTAVSAIISLVDMIMAMAPEKKPKPCLAWVSLLLAIGAAIVFVVATMKIYATGESEGILEGVRFNVYMGATIAYGCNVIIMIANIVGNHIGLARYKKNGKAY